MKKIINGKLYNTSTAESIAVHSFSHPRDFHYVREELFCKSNGEFFLHGVGGGRSRYAEKVDNNGWCAGEAIIALSDDEAKAWVEQHCSVDTYEQLWGAVAE